MRAVINSLKYPLKSVSVTLSLHHREWPLSPFGTRVNTSLHNHSYTSLFSVLFYPIKSQCACTYAPSKKVMRLFFQIVMSHGEFENLAVAHRFTNWGTSIRVANCFLLREFKMSVCMDDVDLSCVGFYVQA